MTAESDYWLTWFSPMKTFHELGSLISNIALCAITIVSLAGCTTPTLKSEAMAASARSTAPHEIFAGKMTVQRNGSVFTDALYHSLRISGYLATSAAEFSIEVSVVKEVMPTFGFEKSGSLEIIYRVYDKKQDLLFSESVSSEARANVSDVASGYERAVFVTEQYGRKNIDSFLDRLPKRAEEIRSSRLAEAARLRQQTEQAAAQLDKDRLPKTPPAGGPIAKAPASPAVPPVVVVPKAQTPAPPAPRPLPPQAVPPRALAPEGRTRSTGSGFIVGPQLVVTNYHVIEGCTTLKVRRDSEILVATIRASSERSDIAAITVDRSVGAPAAIRSSALLGEDTVVAGYPLAGVLSSDLIVTSGHVNALAGLGNDPNMLQISAPVQPGNSGGPLIDRSGSIVGMVVSKLNVERLAKLTGDMAQNVNFAIKPEILRLFLDANRIAYRTATPGERLEGFEIAERARSFTVQIICD